APVRGDRVAAIPALAAVRERARPGPSRPAARPARPDAHLGRRARPGPIRRRAAWRSRGRRARRPAHGRPGRRGAGRGGDHRERLGPGARPAAAGLSPHSVAGGRATWIVAPAPDLDAIARTQPAPDWTTLHRGAWGRAGRPFAAVEDDTILRFEALPTRDSVGWFGPAFREFAIAAPDTWPALRRTGIPLTDWWRRTALAWVLQSPALVRRETDGLVLLWRRDITDRLRRLAPYAAFDAAAPVVSDG